MRRSSRAIPYLFVLPQVALVGVFGLVPLLYNLYLSFMDVTLVSMRFAWFDNYRRLLSDSAFWESASNTLLFTAMAVPVTMAISFVLAWGLNVQRRFRYLLRTMFLFPHLISWVVVAILWSWIFSPHYGIANHLLDLLGIGRIPWLQRYPLLMIASATVWATTGYYMVIFLAGLQGIPTSLYEAARIDGASQWQQVRYITLPMLRPITLLVSIYATLNSFKAFDQIYVMTGGGPGRASTVLVLYVYRLVFEEMRMGYAAAVSTVMFLVLLAVTYAQFKLLREEG